MIVSDNDGGASLAAALLAVLLVLMLNACGAAPDRSARRHEDQALVSANRMAQYAFEKGKYEQAAQSYRQALERAYIRGDAAAILDARYNLALCQMALGRYGEALGLVAQAKADLGPGSASPPPDLSLLEATLHYRKGAPEKALAVTDTLLAHAPSPSAEVLARTHFLRGLIADGRKDWECLRQSIAALGVPENEVVQADAAELRGRLAMAEKDWPRAIAALDAATDTRRNQLDYRRMAITLALSADACEKAGQKEQSAHRYLRAGRSAALRGDSDNARQWLADAIRLFDLMGESALSVEATNILSGLESAEVR